MMVLVSMMSEIEAGWKNNWDQPLNLQCSSERAAIYQVVSTHHNYYEDRRFDFNCRQVLSVSGPVSCSWSGIVANYVIFFVLCESLMLQLYSVLYRCFFQRLITSKNIPEYIINRHPYFVQSEQMFEVTVQRYIKAICFLGTAIVNSHIWFHWGVFRYYKVC